MKASSGLVGGRVVRPEHVRRNRQLGRRQPRDVRVFGGHGDAVDEVADPPREPHGVRVVRGEGPVVLVVRRELHVRLAEERAEAVEGRPDALVVGPDRREDRRRRDGRREELAAVAQRRRPAEVAAAHEHGPLHRRVDAALREVGEQHGRQVRALAEADDALVARRLVREVEVAEGGDGRR